MCVCVGTCARACVGEGLCAALWESIMMSSSYGCLLFYEYILACRPVAGQRPRDKQLYKSRYLVTASQTNMFPRQQLNYNDEELCFPCGACRDVISGTSLELQLVEFSQSEE
jgi:hypothetical protein